MVPARYTVAMTARAPLSRSAEDYLKQLYMLGHSDKVPGKGGGQKFSPQKVRTQALADAQDVATAREPGMLRKLTAQGLVVAEPSRGAADCT